MQRGLAQHALQSVAARKVFNGRAEAGRFIDLTRSRQIGFESGAQALLEQPLGLDRAGCAEEFAGGQQSGAPSRFLILDHRQAELLYGLPVSFGQRLRIFG